MIVTSIAHYFETLPARFIPSGAKGLKATFQFELAGEQGGTWHVTVDDGTMAIHEGAAAGTPSATIKMKALDYIKMVNGELSGTMAFMKGQMKITGNMMMAQKMQNIFPPNK